MQTGPCPLCLRGPLTASMPSRCCHTSYFCFRMPTTPLVLDPCRPPPRLVGAPSEDALASATTHPCRRCGPR
eukprot:16388030-Heterocapsa_arctica.AAC.1